MSSCLSPLPKIPSHILYLYLQLYSFAGSLSVRHLVLLRPPSLQNRHHTHWWVRGLSPPLQLFFECKKCARLSSYKCTLRVYRRKGCWGGLSSGGVQGSLPARCWATPCGWTKSSIVSSGRLFSQYIPTLLLFRMIESSFTYQVSQIMMGDWPVTPCCTVPADERRTTFFLSSV